MVDYVTILKYEFYLAGAEAMAQSRHQVQAVDLLTVGWDSKGALRNYYLANLHALERGVHITRIFVFRRAYLTDVAMQRVLQSQLANCIDVRRAFVVEVSLRTGDGGWPPAASGDFAVFVGRVVSERAGPGGAHFGRKTQRVTEVARYRRLFESVAHNAHPVQVHDGRVLPADMPTEGRSAAELLAASTPA